MNKKTLGAGMLALALPALLLSANSIGANAATVTSSVTAIDSCAWQLVGVPSDLTLGSEDNVKYKGVDLPVSATSPNLILGLAGTAGSASATDSNASTECSFYNSLQAGGVNLEISTASFTSSYTTNGGSTYIADPEDNNLNFALTESNPLGVTTGGSEECTTAFKVEGTADLYVAETPSTLISTMITGDPVSPQTLVQNLNATGANVKCDIGLTFDFTIPERTGVPAGAGNAYKFSGPVLTFTKLPVG